VGHAVTIVDWLRKLCADYELEPIAVYRRHSAHPWPVIARDDDELQKKLAETGHFLALPKEPAALANVLEVSLVEFLVEKIRALSDVTIQRGTERGYPDVELSGSRFGGRHHALDVKVARRSQNGRKTQSRITLYTGNTYFRYPSLQWPGTFRPFEQYDSHLDLIAIYTLNEESLSRIDDLELIVQETWRIASKQRSSTTREYIGAVTLIDDLKSGKGEFRTSEEFYAFWRRYNFKIGRVVQQQLDKLLSHQGRRPPNKR
jgi:Restriction endonuclease EcoRV